MSVFMCALRDCKFTKRNANVCGPHIAPDKLIKNVTTEIQEAKCLRVYSTRVCVFGKHTSELYVVCMSNAPL